MVNLWWLLVITISLTKCSQTICLIILFCKALTWSSWMLSFLHSVHCSVSFCENRMLAIATDSMFISPWTNWGWSSNPNIMVLEGRDFERWLDHEGSFINNESLYKRGPENLLSVSTIWGYSKKTDACEPGSGPLLDIESASTLICQPPYK